MTDNSIEDRLIRLEEQAAHQSRTIEDLSDELARMTLANEQLKHKIERLIERFLVLEEQARDAIPVQRPPHY